MHLQPSLVLRNQHSRFPLSTHYSIIKIKPEPYKVRLLNSRWENGGFPTICHLICKLVVGKVDRLATYQHTSQRSLSLFDVYYTLYSHTNDRFWSSGCYYSLGIWIFPSLRPRAGMSTGPLYFAARELDIERTESSAKS